MKLEELLKADGTTPVDPKLGPLWGEIRSGPNLLQMLADDRIRVAEFDNIYAVEVTRDDGTVGIYELPHKAAVDLFP